MNGPGGWSASVGGANGGSHAPVGSGAVRASGKFVRFGEMPDTNGLSQIGSLPHCVTKFFSGCVAGVRLGSSAKLADGSDDREHLAVAGDVPRTIKVHAQPAAAAPARELSWPLPRTQPNVGTT